MSARRPLLTALGATTLLAALWFVPSAGAAAPGAEESRTGVPAGANTADASADGTDRTDGTGTAEGTAPRAQPLSLADTGSVDTTPYLLGGTLCLGVGAGFVVFSVRRSHSP
ncbi:hypothetical protein [Streptomyces sp. NBC_01294]|uniref:hypothetical protein n=1 Tax=Streptomyces sp. NBC_01294 TaxID=2903815 RepID=UPI002DD8C42A|nr:hypothetical protein [Streptomyces sp. NBC_01294]WRZ57443.1 hypothetical protein OG534_13655 [Streptomyces sp. NBC_01294]